jgi:hypothetical protein
MAYWAAGLLLADLNYAREHTTSFILLLIITVVL